MAVTWNPLDVGSAVILSNGNLTEYSPTGGGSGNVRANIGITSGKKYWEIHYDSGYYPAIGIANIDAPVENNGTGNLNNYTGNVTRLYHYSGKLFPGGITYGSAIVIGDTIGVALDMDAGTIGFSKNGESMGIGFTDVKSSLALVVYPFVCFGGGQGSPCGITANFGATPFTYPIPDGYTALDSGTPTPINITVSSVKATVTSQAIDPTVSATSTSIIDVNVNGVVATSTSQGINPTINTISNISITPTTIRNTSIFNNPIVSAIKNEIARLNLSELVRKPIIETKDRTIINTETIRNIRTEVI